MKALTLSQPWATAIARGHKRVETRGWHPADNPGVLAIASGNKNMTGSQREIAEGFFGDIAFPRRSILAVAQVRGFARTEEIVGSLSEEEIDLGDYRTGRWAWRLGEIVTLARPIEMYPVELKPGAKKRLPGMLQLWDLPYVFERKVLTAIGGRGEFERLAASVVGR